MKRFEFSILLGVIFCISVSFLSFSRECEDIRSSVLRLHVLANSDSRDDQNLKLMVRDRLLDEAPDIFESTLNLGEAESAAEENLDRLTAVAQDEITRRGYDYPVEIKLEDAYFETRTYGDVTLPAGRYRALRVLIGSGEGKNWWCVMFPPMCISTATGGQTVEMDDVLTPNQVEIVESGGYEVRFKALEWIEDLFS